MDFETVANRDGTDGAAPRRPILAEDTVRYAGEAIAIVVAETRAAGARRARPDRLRLRGPAGACRDRGRRRRRSTRRRPTNLAYDWAFGDEAATDAAFAAAAHTTRLELVDNRVMGMSMEPRGCFAEWTGGRLHVAYSGQGVWPLKNELADKFGLDAADVRATTPDVGGGFGIKGFNYPEYFAVAFAARELDRPVRWMSGRGEAMLTDNGGRDHVTVAEAAFDADHRLIALRIDCVSNLGAYNSPYGQLIASDVALKVLPGVYDVQKAFINVKGVFTNTTPVDAYRGAGRPESIYTIERLMDWSARAARRGPDRVPAQELHRRATSSPTARSWASSTTSATSTGCSTAR